MSMSIKKRLYLGAGALATVGAVGTLVAGTTFGLFSASAGTPQASTFSSGTVSLTAPVAGYCHVTNAVPGESGTCTLVATYTGSAPAYLGLDVSASGALLSASNNDTNGLHYTVTEGSVSYDTASNDLVNTTPETNGAAAHTFTVNWDIPLATDNTFQNADATITLTAHAVQSQHNPEAGTACTAGTSCSDITWS